MILQHLGACQVMVSGVYQQLKDTFSHHMSVITCRALQWPKRKIKNLHVEWLISSWPQVEEVNNKKPATRIFSASCIPTFTNSVQRSCSKQIPSYAHAAAFWVLHEVKHGFDFVFVYFFSAASPGIRHKERKYLLTDLKYLLIYFHPLAKAQYEKYPSLPNLK